MDEKHLEEFCDDLQNNFTDVERQATVNFLYLLTLNPRPARWDEVVAAIKSKMPCADYVISLIDEIVREVKTDAPRVH